MSTTVPGADLAVLVLGTPAPRRRFGRRAALLAGAGALAAAAVAVTVGNHVLAPPQALRPAAAVTAAVPVQQFTNASGDALRRVKRDGFSAVEDDVQAVAPTASFALGPATPAGAAQTYAAAAVKRHGWSAANFSCLVALWSRESGWNTHAGNADGAYGIPQALPGSKMGSAGGDWVNSAQVQIDWGLGYIAGRYGSPCGAWAQSEATGSY